MPQEVVISCVDRYIRGVFERDLFSHCPCSTKICFFYPSNRWSFLV